MSNPESDRLHGKYHVARRDNRDLPGGDKANAKYFVLDYANDPHARIALAAYADACEADLPALAADLRAQIADVGGLPDEPGHVIEFRENGWTIKHPLSCRPKLFDCPVNRAAERDLTHPPAVLGLFECSTNDLGDRLLIGDRVDIERPIDLDDRARPARSTKFQNAIAGRPLDLVSFTAGSGRQYEGERSDSCPGDGIAGHRHDIRCIRPPSPPKPPAGRPQTFA